MLSRQAPGLAGLRCRPGHKKTAYVESLRVRRQAVFMQGRDRPIHRCVLVFFALVCVFPVLDQISCQKFSEHLSNCAKHVTNLMVQDRQNEIPNVRSLSTICNRLRRPLQTHLSHSGDQRGGLHTQKLRRAIKTFDFPGGLFQDSKKILTFEALHF